MKTERFADLYTREGECVTAQPWQSYPRPQMRRDSFFNLNGEWEFAVSDAEGFPQEYPEKILVPFPPESLLSGIHRGIPETVQLYYRRGFALPEGFRKERVLLHIGAADQIAAVYINGTYIGEHRGGYEAFCFDITHALCPGENTVLIRITDHMSERIFPSGKQSANRGGMWYTPVSGLWQTVWLESVPERYIQRLSVQTGENWAEITVEGGEEAGTIMVQLPSGHLIAQMKDRKAKVFLDEPHLWSPEDPFLYPVTVCAGEDRVESYFALRTLSVKTVDGYQRLCLNGKPYFFHGVLDQGYWSDGLFTPAAPECYERDILAMKELGFNTLRKHVKVEPEQFYYDCDRLGMIVFQDMVSNGDYHFVRDTLLPNLGFKTKKDENIHRDADTRKEFLRAMEQTVEQLKNHPCICYWTIFNEGWGQFESTRCYRKLKELDNSRFVATVSGWFKGGESDVAAEHTYFRAFKPYRSRKPLVLSEFGGYTFVAEKHVFNTKQTYGYRHFKEQKAFEGALVSLYEREIIPSVEKGLCGSIYTQLSDVEDEVNGLLSFDRRVMKVSAQRMKEIARKLQEKMP